MIAADYPALQPELEDFKRGNISEATFYRAAVNTKAEGVLNSCASERIKQAWRTAISAGVNQDTLTDMEVAYRNRESINPPPAQVEDGGRTHVVKPEARAYYNLLLSMQRNVRPR